MDLLDAEEHLKDALKDPLQLAGLTVEGFRLLEMLHREGALPIAHITKRRGRRRESTLEVIGRLEKRGWVRRAIVKLPAVSFERAHLPKSKKDVPREGQKIAVAGLTAFGKRLIVDVLMNYSKVFESIMRGDRWTRTGVAEPDLPEVARGRPGEVFPRDSAGGRRSGSGGTEREGGG